MRHVDIVARCAQSRWGYAPCTQVTLSVTCASDIAEPSRAEIRRSLQEISQATLRSIECMVGATTSW